MSYTAIVLIVILLRAPSVFKGAVGSFYGNLGGGTPLPGRTAQPLYLDPGTYSVDNGSGGKEMGGFAGVSDGAITAPVSILQALPVSATVSGVSVGGLGVVHRRPRGGISAFRTDLFSTAFSQQITKTAAFQQAGRL